MSAPERWPRLERQILADLASRFAQSPSHQLGAELASGPKVVADGLGAQACALVELAEEPEAAWVENLSVTPQAAAPAPATR